MQQLGERQREQRLDLGALPIVAQWTDGWHGRFPTDARRRTEESGKHAPVCQPECRSGS
jgi:hypothetical protein